MALVPCPECQREVSTEARECPQCAFPYPGKKTTERLLGIRPVACPRCHGPISPDIQACPHCGVSLSKNLVTSGRGSRGSTLNHPTSRHGSLLIDTGMRKIASGNAAGQKSRRRVPLWQEPLTIKEVPSARHRRHPANSILVGLILVVIVAISVVFGALWQLEGLNPLQAILNWRM